MRKIVEWEVTMKCNYSCSYCTNLDKTLKPVLDKTKIEAFIRYLGETYPGVEIFVFGGEPFVHPHIEFIIQTFNRLNIPFVIQTNFSAFSVKVMHTISDPFRINVSIHPTEVAIDELLQVFEAPPLINTIDVMYTGREALKYYFEVKKLATTDRVFLTPISDFGDGRSDVVLAEYNSLRQSPYSKIINFEQVRYGDRYRSDVWLDPTFTTKGKPCLYTDRYFLYGPNMELYNCCYRVVHNGTCQQDCCFLM